MDEKQAKTLGSLYVRRTVDQIRQGGGTTLLVGQHEGGRAGGEKKSPAKARAKERKWIEIHATVAGKT